MAMGLVVVAECHKLLLPAAKGLPALATRCTGTSKQALCTSTQLLPSRAAIH